MKVRYTKLKSTGLLLEHQSGGDESNPEYLQTLIDNAVSSGHNKEDIEAGYEDDEIVQGWVKDANEATKTYVEKRKTDYPGIGEQLDLLWHAIDDGTLDKTSDFYTSLKATKDKYPKT